MNEYYSHLKVSTATGAAVWDYEGILAAMQRLGCKSFNQMADK